MNVIDQLIEHYSSRGDETAIGLAVNYGRPLIPVLVRLGFIGNNQTRSTDWQVEVLDNSFNTGSGTFNGHNPMNEEYLRQQYQAAAKAYMHYQQMVDQRRKTQAMKQKIQDEINQEIKHKNGG